MKFISSLLVFAFFTTVLSASDFAKEQRWIDQVADSIMDGDVEMLPVGNREIFGIYTEADENPKHRAIIVIHGLGAHPNWAQIVQPVRVEMTQYGWNTLSIQMPVLANGIGGDQYAPLFVEVAPRIEAAITFLKQNEMQEIVLVSHSMGSAMSADYFAKNPNSAISKFVAIGLGAPNSVKDIHIPMFDLYGSDDFPNVLKNANKRKKNAQQAGNTHYKQLEVLGANHFFDGKDEVLITIIKDWLE